MTTPTRVDAIVDELHGTSVPDPYRWLEDGADPEVEAWQQAHTAHATEVLAALPQRDWLYQRFQHLWRYDDESVPRPALKADVVWYHTKRADQDKWVLCQRSPDHPDGRVILDPNTWESTKTLAFNSASPDCRYLAYGIATGGDENPLLRVLDLQTLEHLPDEVAGWRVGGVSWKHDNSGFFYGNKPEEEHYHHRSSFHRLGTPKTDDVVVYGDSEVKEHYHATAVQEDGRYAILSRHRFDKTALRLLDLQTDDVVDLVDDMDDHWMAEVVEDRILFTTDNGAGRYRVLAAPVSDPTARTELVAEHATDVLSHVMAVRGLLYLVYEHDAHTRIAIHRLDGSYLRDLPLPGIGTAGVWGWWSKGRVWVRFTSFARPQTVYTYDPDSDELTLYKTSPIDFDPCDIVEEQVRATSADGTEVPMFIVHNRTVSGPRPVLLTGYGGFNISRNPGFSTLYAVWVEAGGAVVVSNLRGGGEYGKDWHEAGMRDRKQNVFDDFLACAQWLLDNGWTAADQLAISGGSNGGLLVSAAMVQRPDLFAAVLCQVPLTDMLRFHHFGLAAIWTEEYGSPDDPEMFPHIYAYSPYHNVEERPYPALLVTGGLNDARTDPAHARKFYARVAAAQQSDEPVLLQVYGDSGHGGGVTIDTLADQWAGKYAFLMQQVGLQTP